ncbi:hypothetical protein COCOBI_14-4550 [Coccomyxa sp. Obi]|nr:hypothetical protein COCOBI_14-4550 [Coccomyxa sp. Obi]
MHFLSRLAVFHGSTCVQHKSLRHGEAPAVADLMIAMVSGRHLAEARDVVAVLIARKHADEAALVALWMIHVDESTAVARLTAALVDEGGLALACEIKEAMVMLGESMAGKPCYELINCKRNMRDDIEIDTAKSRFPDRMGRVDVVARMVIELVNTRHTAVVCACIETLVMTGHADSLADVALTVADMDRPDVVATVEVTLVEIGRLNLAIESTVALIKSGYPWVVAATRVEMVRQGHAKVTAMIQAELSRDGSEGAIIEVSIIQIWLSKNQKESLNVILNPRKYKAEVAVLLLRSGFASEWAAIAAEHIRSGEVDFIARQLAGLVRTGRPFLAAEAATALVHAASAKVVAEVLREMVEMGQADVAADLAADLAQRELSVACIVMGCAEIGAVLLLRLVDTGRTAEVVRINNCLVDSDRTQEAAAITEALAAQTEVMALMETLKTGGARILPEARHDATMRLISATSAKKAAAAVAYERALTGQAPTSSKSPNLIEDVFDTAVSIGKR